MHFLFIQLILHGPTKGASFSLQGAFQSFAGLQSMAVSCNTAYNSSHGEGIC